MLAWPRQISGSQVRRAQELMARGLPFLEGRTLGEAEHASSGAATTDLAIPLDRARFAILCSLHSNKRVSAGRL